MTDRCKSIVGGVISEKLSGADEALLGHDLSATSIWADRCPESRVLRAVGGLSAHLASAIEQVSTNCFEEPPSLPFELLFRILNATLIRNRLAGWGRGGSLRRRTWLGAHRRRSGEGADKPSQSDRYAS